ncbi:BglG family transcription antiterminator [Enorma phocaeensis]|uniref:BglG family transcription antiterminator n=1 Tax=Enorma phocaeensis TaxID=1871019 RepID=UPI001957DDCA|nr:PTS sugar transporter subunit IIA [Enorma phocaeensis]MBM6953212.1 transcription antiterminator [Enorma phocaeensis]
MFGFDRLDREFSLIRNVPYTPVSKLATTFGVTDRTIRNDISSINAVLERHGARVLLKRGVGYHVEVLDEDAYQAFVSNKSESSRETYDLSSSTDRLRAVMSILLDANGHVSSTDIANAALVSESTAQGYIRDVRIVFERYGLECVTNRMKGVRVFGSEHDKRLCYMNEIIMKSQEERGRRIGRDALRIFAGIDVKPVEKMLAEALSSSGVTASDYGFTSLLLNVLLMAKRVKSGNIIEASVLAEPPAEICETADAIISGIQSLLGVTVPAAEKCWLHPLLISYSNIATRSVDPKRLQALTDGIIEAIRRGYGFDLSYDNVLRHGIYEHLKSIYESRSGNQPGQNNPLLKTVKESFPLAFEVALSVCNEVLCDPIYALNEDDISYIALHIGAAIERRKSAYDTRLNVLICCDAGKAAQQVMQTRVELLFNNKLSVKRCLSRQELILLEDSALDGTDLILTTSSIKDSRIPSITVDFRLLEDDVKLITHWLEEKAVGISRRLEGIFDKEMFFFEKQPVSRDELLRRMCSSIVATHTVDEHLFDLVLEREALSTTAIGKCVAIPHPIRLCSTETHVAVAVLGQGITWSGEGPEGDSDEDVRIVFLLSMKPQMSDQIELLYDLIVKIANNEDLQHEIVRCRTFEELLAALDNASLNAATYR